ncbi:hypothetical protein CU097_001857, partial [Rhizopus azygosporus]
IQTYLNMTRVTVYYQWHTLLDTTSIMHHIIQLNTLPYISLCDNLYVDSIVYSDHPACHLHYTFTQPPPYLSPPLNIKHKWHHTGSWSQERSLLTHFQPRPSTSYPDRQSDSSFLNDLDEENEKDQASIKELKIKMHDLYKISISLLDHDDSSGLSDKFTQLCLKCTQRDDTYIVRLLHPPELLKYLAQDVSDQGLRISITMTRSDDGQFTVNDKEWPLRDEHDSSTTDEESDHDYKEEDIFVDGMEELDETSPLATDVPPLLELQQPSRPTVQHKVSSSSVPLMKVPQPTASNSTPTHAYKHIQVSDTNESISDKEISVITVPESDPLALQKAYQLFTQFIRSTETPTTVIQEPCRDNGYVTVKKIDVPDHPMGAFLVETMWKDCSLWDVKAVIESVGARKVWDNTFENSTLLHALTPTSAIWHTKVQGTWPVSPRDYICFQGQYASSYMVDLVSTSCVGESYRHKPLPKETSGYTRATMDVMGWRLEYATKDTVLMKGLMMTQFSTWVINYITSRYLVQSLAAVQMAKDYLGTYGAPPSLENLMNAVLMNLKHDHERKTWRCEYSRRTESDDKATKVMAGATTTSLIRIDKQRWALSTGNKYSTIIDPPPSRVSAIERIHDPYGVWLIIEHDEVFIIPFHGKILVIIKPDDTTSSTKEQVPDCQISVNGGPIVVEKEQAIPEEIEKEFQKAVSQASKDKKKFVSEEHAVSRAIDQLSVPPQEHTQAVLAFLKRADEQFGWTAVSDKNGIKTSKRPGTKQKKKEPDSFLQDAFTMDVPEPFMIYKASKVIENYSAEEVLAVVSDTQNVRKAYDDTIEEIDVLRHLRPGCKVVRQTLKAIFPFKPREVYTYSCLAEMPSSDTLSSVKRMVCMESSIPGFPIVSTKKPRGNLFISAWIIEAVDPYTTATNYPIPSTRVTYVAALDLGSLVPSYISNLVANSWFPKKIQAVISYLKSNGPPPFITEPLPLLVQSTESADIKWDEISSFYDRDTHQFKVICRLEIRQEETTASNKRSTSVSRKGSLETVGSASKVGAEEGEPAKFGDQRFPADSGIRRGSFSSNAPKKRVMNTENKDRLSPSISGSSTAAASTSITATRDFTFLKTTIGLRSFPKGYEIQTQLFDTTQAEKHKNLTDKLIIHVSEPALTQLTDNSNNHIKHSIHLKTHGLSSFTLPAKYEFEFDLLPIPEEDPGHKEPRLTVSHVLGEDENKDSSSEAKWNGRVIVNGDRIEIGKDTQVKVCARDVEKSEESKSHNTLQSKLLDDGKKKEHSEQVPNSSLQESTSRNVAVTQYMPGGVVASALGNVSAGVNNFSAPVGGEGNAGNNKGYSTVDREHNPAVSTSNNVKQPVNNELSALVQHDSRVAAMSIRDIRRLLYYERPYISGINEENVRLLLQVPWFKGWKVQIVAVKQ